jgi:nitronate monooxygenase
MMRPVIIQGGMGIGVSGWPLARAVSLRGQLGVVSGTGIDALFVRRLQDGDHGGHLRRAAAHFPLPRVAADVLSRYYLASGRRPGAPYALLPMWRQTVSLPRQQIAMLAAFCEVYLAKAGHGGLVGMNLLTKVQLPNLATIYGAMMAGVDYLIMGAGIPREIPAALDAFARGKPASLKFDVEGLEKGESKEISFHPHAHWPHDPPTLPRPLFLPVVAAHSLATMLMRKADGRIDGFVVEGPTAGGHNAPPRGRMDDEYAEPVYGERDVVDLDVMRGLGVPFWLAGSTGSPEQLPAARAAGAAGVQVGTLFAYARESGVEASLKARVLADVRDRAVSIRTDPRASPTGYPFKVVELEGTLSEPATYARRERNCDLGYLRTAFKRADGRIDYRCPGEPVDTYVKKSGIAADTIGRKCLCNALMSNIGHAQVREDGLEPSLLTSGDDLREMSRFTNGLLEYGVADVLEYLLGRRAPIMA